MIDFKGVVEIESLANKHLNNICECVVPNVEVAWDSENFNEPCEPASLFHLQLFLDLFKQLTTWQIFIFNGLYLKHVTHFVHPGLVHLPVIVDDVVAHVVFYVQANYVTRHSRHLNVDVDVELV